MATIEIETKHVGWILGWALEKCAAQIRDAEEQIVRHRHFLAEGRDYDGGCDFNKHGLPKERAQTIEDLAGYMYQYRQIYAFLVQAKAANSERSAQEFAQGLFGGFAGEPRRKR